MRGLAGDSQRLDPPPQLGWIGALRGIAVLVVVLWHIHQLVWTQTFVYYYPKFIIPYLSQPSLAELFNFPSGVKWAFSLLSLVCNLGYQGVHIFFALSGFGLLVSWRRSAQVKENKSRSTWSHWMPRRLWRVLPMLWISLAIVFVLLVVLGVEGLYPPQYLSEDSGEWLKLAGMTAVGIHGLAEGSFWSINPALWFIAPLLQFYLVFPLLVWLLRRLGRARLLGAAILLTLLSRWLGIFELAGLNKYIAFGAFFGSRAGEFCLGMVLADYYLEHGHCWRPPRVILLLCGLGYLGGLFLGASRWGSIASDLIIGLSLFPLLFALALRIRSRLFYTLGRYSYGIFLFHVPMLYPLTSLLQPLIPTSSAVATVLGSLLLFGLVLGLVCLAGAALEWIWERAAGFRHK